MEEREEKSELEELLDEPIAGESYDSIMAATYAGDQELANERIANSLERVSDAVVRLTGATNSLDKTNRNSIEYIKEQKRLTEETNSNLSKLSHFTSDLNDGLVKQLENFEIKLNRVIDNHDKDLKESIKNSRETLVKATSLAATIIVCCSLLGAVLAFVGLFFTVYLSEFWRSLWVDNILLMDIVCVVVFVLLLFSIWCFRGKFQDWWNSKKDKS